jgi:hypothetical protein
MSCCGSEERDVDSWKVDKQRGLVLNVRVMIGKEIVQLGTTQSLVEGNEVKNRRTQQFMKRLGAGVPS